MALIPAYDSRTGAKRYVPEHYFDNKILSRGLRKTPPASKQQTTTNAPAKGEKEKN